MIGQILSFFIEYYVGAGVHYHFSTPWGFKWKNKMKYNLAKNKNFL